MTSMQILDVDLVSLCKKQYDICFFSSGYESRCIHIPNLFDSSMVANPIVLGFKEKKHSGSRKNNDKFFGERWHCDPVLLSADNDKPIFDFLHKCSQSIDGTIHILIDYSSMSRLWYAAILNWARFGAPGKDVVIDFIYAMGKYEEEKKPMVIREMVSIPGCEGRAYRLRESIAVFGLGFHGLAALCVLDRLEADTAYIFLASPGSSEEYVAKTQEINKDLIDNHKTKPLLKLPLASIETCYRNIAETIAPHRLDGEITLVPMGPKPHVLASILVAMCFPEVACLRVSSVPDLLDIKPTGEIVSTRVIIKDELT